EIFERERSLSMEPTSKVEAAPDIPSNIKAFSIQNGNPTSGLVHGTTETTPGVLDLSPPAPPSDRQPAPRPHLRNNEESNSNDTPLKGPTYEREVPQVDAVDDRVRNTSALT